MHVYVISDVFTQHSRVRGTAGAETIDPIVNKLKFVGSPVRHIGSLFKYILQRSFGYRPQLEPRRCKL